MYISPTERMKKIHLWVGTTTADEETYNEYFDQEDDISQFSKDIGFNEEYDEDFIGILPLFGKEIPVEDILENEVPLDKNSVAEVLEICKKMGIEKANAAFYLTDSSITVEEPYKDEYNGLKYIGEYKSAL